MALNQIREQLRYDIPAELTQIEPGQITYFISKDGITQRIAEDIFNLAIHQDSLYDERTKINVVPTDRLLLIDTFAGRIPEKAGLPYKVVLGTMDCLREFEDVYYSGELDDLDSDAPKARIDGKPRPVVVTIDPSDYQVAERQIEPEQFSCPYANGSVGGMQALVAEKNTPTLADMQNKISDLLAKCERYGYDIDVVGLKSIVKEAQRQAKEYQLELDIQEKTWLSVQKKERVITVCDIYIVGDGIRHKIDIDPAQKALYLTAILQGGFLLSDVSFVFLEDMATIFRQIPGHQLKEKGGMASGKSSSSGIGVMKKRIRDAIASAIGFGPAVDEFAIEGYRGQEVSIRKATEQHKAQIRKYFGL